MATSVEVLEGVAVCGGGGGWGRGSGNQKKAQNHNSGMFELID